MITACGSINGKYCEKIDPQKIHLSLIEENTIWADVENPTKEEAEYLERQLRIHHLALEDALNEKQRAKVERYDEFHFIVIHSVTETSKFETTQLNIIIMKNLVLSIHLKPLKFISALRQRLAENPQLVNRGPDFITYMLLDASSDQLFPLMDRLEGMIDKVEEGVFRENGKDEKLMNTLFKAKKELLHLRKTTWPQMEVLNVLASGELKYIQKRNLIYFRDVYDHLIRINTLIETQRELVSSSMEGHLMVVSNNLNKIMKKLTAITAIIMLPTLIAGIYGTNFIFVPELKWEFGFYAALASMLLSTILLAIFFKQKEWI
ncbi:MAG: magnesium/cobalt transporter CorA [Candidatus Micrarchaeota archaeon]